MSKDGMIRCEVCGLDFACPYYDGGPHKLAGHTVCDWCYWGAHTLLPGWREHVPSWYAELIAKTEEMHDDEA